MCIWRERMGWGSEEEVVLPDCGEPGYSMRPPHSTPIMLSQNSFSGSHNLFAALTKFSEGARHAFYSAQPSSVPGRKLVFITYLLNEQLTKYQS